MAAVLVIAAVILLDQVTKMAVAGNEAYWNVPVIENFFHITYAKNTGMAWSLLSGQQALLAIAAAGAIGVMIWYLKTAKLDIFSKYGLYLMIGGAAGNLIDRLVLNYVRDFLNFYIFGYDFPIFNVADMALCIGVGLLLLASFIEGEGEKHAS